MEVEAGRDGGVDIQLPGRRKDTDGLVVAGQAVDTRLNENEAELGVLVLAVALEVLADSHGLDETQSIPPNFHPPLRPAGGGVIATHLLDQHVEVLGDLRGEALLRKKITPSVFMKKKPSRGRVEKAQGAGAMAWSMPRGWFGERVYLP